MFFFLLPTTVVVVHFNSFDTTKKLNEMMMRMMMMMMKKKFTLLLFFPYCLGFFSFLWFIRCNDLHFFLFVCLFVWFGLVWFGSNEFHLGKVYIEERWKIVYHRKLCSKKFSSFSSTNHYNIPAMTMMMTIQIVSYCILVKFLLLPSNIIDFFSFCC